eukprot:scaffold91359_cov44-Phaeocystis_antarctica.AAC.2
MSNSSSGFCPRDTEALARTAEGIGPGRRRGAGPDVGELVVCVRGDGHDASQDGHELGQPLVVQLRGLRDYVARRVHHESYSDGRSEFSDLRDDRQSCGDADGDGGRDNEREYYHNHMLDAEAVGDASEGAEGGEGDEHADDELGAREQPVVRAQRFK